MKQEVKLNRSDDRPIAFMGEEIINESTKDRDATRWYTIRVFKTDEGYMVGIAHITCWKGERDQYWAHEAKSKRDVVTMIQNHFDPVETPRAAHDNKDYLDLIDRVAQLIRADGQIKKNENPGDNAGRTKTNLFPA